MQSDMTSTSDLLLLYLHQNYTDFCNTVEECDNIMSEYSSIDVLGSKNHVNILFETIWSCLMSTEGRLRIPAICQRRFNSIAKPGRASGAKIAQARDLRDFEDAGL